MNHQDLVYKAEKWLKSQGCGVVLRDPLRAATHNGERPDAIGWRDGLSIVVECKVSIADFLADRDKQFRIEPWEGMGDWRFYLCQPGIIKPEDLPASWGLLYSTPRQTKKIHGVPSNCNWWSKKPFNGNKMSENQMLCSALRRIAERGLLGSIYEDE